MSDLACVWGKGMTWASYVRARESACLHVGFRTRGKETEGKRCGNTRNPRWCHAALIQLCLLPNPVAPSPSPIYPHLPPLCRPIRAESLRSAPSRSAWPFSDVLTSAMLPAPHSSPLLHSAQWHGLQNLHQQAMFMLLPSSLGYVYGVTSPHTLFAYVSEGGRSLSLTLPH
jgi:hypothetical protein